MQTRLEPKEEGRSSNPDDERLLKVAIEREPLRVAKQWGYEVHRLSPKDIVDKEDYARGYRYRLSKADPTQPYPQIVMARSEGEVATFLKRQIEGNPVGTCYEDAWRYLLKEKEGELIHGSVESEGKRIGHAWVELPTGFIWEPETGKYFTREAFNIAASPIEEHRYTVEEAAIMLARVGKHGPWIEEEKLRFLEGGNPVSMYRSVAQLPEFRGTAWRAESGYWHDPGTTVADIIRFEQEELGNEYPDISDELLKDLDRFPASDAVWVNRRRKDCLFYLSEGESEEAVGRVHLGEGAKIVSPDYCGGFLVLRGGAEPILEKGGNLMPRTESERLSFHERIFGKGSVPPLTTLKRGMVVNKMLPMPPEEGPPLPRAMAIRWPWKK